MKILIIIVILTCAIGSLLVASWNNCSINLIFEGDSLTAGGYFYLVPGLLHSENEICSIDSVALAGDRVNYMLDDAPSEVDAKFSNDRKYNIAVLLGGVNDLAAGKNELDVYRDIQTLAKDRKSSRLQSGASHPYSMEEGRTSQ